MSDMDIEQALHELKQAQDDPQALTVATARIVCARSHPELFEILEAAAIPHWFNAEILTALLQTDSDTASSWMERLIQLPMVETFVARQAWNVHETTRLALRTTFAKNDPDRFKILTRLAADHFSGSDDAQKIEQIYHRLAVSETGADKQLLELYHKWRRTGRYDTQQTLALDLEELLRSNLLSGSALARTLVVLGWIRESRMPLTLADSLAHQAIALFVEAGDEYGEADAREWLGRTLQSEGNLANALLEFQRHIDIMQRLTRRNPDNTDWLRDLSVSHSNVGRVLQAQGNLAGALTEFQAGMDIRRRLNERDPDNTGWLRDLSVSHNNVGKVLQAQGNLDGALKAFQAGMDIRRALTERDPDNTVWLHNLSVSHNRVGRVLKARGNLTGALKAFQADMDIIRSLSRTSRNQKG
jgi:tetratricopeptide (TPR) repeat protein